MSELNREQIIKAWEDEVAVGKEVGLRRDFINYVSITLVNATLSLIKELTEENERLRDILLQFTDIVHKCGNKYGYDTSEISLVPILNEESEIKKQIREETIKEFQSRLNEQRGYDDDWNYNSWWGETINQIAKEMLEGL